jgi:phospholipid/cholesterol/gamma-HCH transport system ATP-binding protein
MTTANLIYLRQVNFAYAPEQKLLKNISLAVKTGSITAIMGGSGSGKTTLLRLFSGQVSANAGLIEVFGKNLNHISNQPLQELRKRMGMLFQFGALFTDLSVAENIAFPIREHSNLPESFIRRIIAMKLEAVGLTGTQDLYPSQLSGGMARRVALARAMALDPELMLYDEPFTGLDPISLNIIAMLIKKINLSLGQTSVLVTHDIAATMAIADYIYFMANGEIIAGGTPDEIRNTTNPAVKQFINGSINGPFAYKYPSLLNYASYLGIK